jgi:hypothetical protein
MNFQTMNKQRKFVLIAALIGVVSMFLSWGKIALFGYAAGSFKGMDIPYSFVPLLCFIGCGILAYLGDQTLNVKITNWFIILICGALSALFAIWKFASMPTGVSAGLGIYLAILAAAGVLVAAFMFRAPEDNIKSGFDSLKKDINSKMNNPNPPNSGNPNPPL